MSKQTAPVGKGIERAAEWAYRGVWSLLSRAFRVPEEAPTLPGDREEEVRSFHPSPAFLRYLKLYFWVLAILVDVLILSLWIGLYLANPSLAAWLAVPALVLAVAPDVVAYLALHLKYDTMWYVMNDRSLRCRRGIWNIVEHTITFENVQNVHVTRGPIQYLFGVWTLVIETAGAAEPDDANRFAVGNKAIMEGIENPEEIRELILDRVRRSRGTGLGEDPREEGPVGVLWSPSHLQALHEILGEVRALQVG